MAGLKVATYLGELVRNLEPDVIETYETKPVFEQAAQYPDLPKVGYIHMLQSQGLLHDTYYYGVDAKADRSDIHVSNRDYGWSNRIW